MCNYLVLCMIDAGFLVLDKAQIIRAVQPLNILKCYGMLETSIGSTYLYKLYNTTSPTSIAVCMHWLVIQSMAFIHQLYDILQPIIAVYKQWVHSSHDVDLQSSFMLYI